MDADKFGVLGVDSNIFEEVQFMIGQEVPWTISRAIRHKFLIRSNGWLWQISTNVWVGADTKNSQFIIHVLDHMDIFVEKFKERLRVWLLVQR